EAFDQLESEAPLSGAVLDLRGNAGGLLEEAVSVVDLFLGAGAILEVRGRGGRVLERHTAREEPDDRNLPLVVLVDEESASAAEIVAGALQDRERALVVGTQTYGKGSVQKLFLFEDGGGLKLTVARYHLPSGRSIADGEGLQPDRPVAAPTVRSEAADAFRAALAAADLPDSERAALLTSFDALAETRGAKRPPGSALPPAARVAADPQLAAAHAWLLDQ
ncbi:MAG: S41 family peptidase, partial [Myxococcota bacterium]|nr:S41 family peptidase [Myxococcota bacterium]